MKTLTFLSALVKAERDSAASYSQMTRLIECACSIDDIAYYKKIYERRHRQKQKFAIRVSLFIAGAENWEIRVKTWKEGYQNLATRIREGTDLKTLIKIVGPTEFEKKGALDRLDLINYLSDMCEWEKDKHQCSEMVRSMRRQYQWAVDAQDRFESRYY